MASAQVIIIGGGLAGCECAWQLAERGITVRLHEMKPYRRTPAQTTDGLAELVCSNSFRSDNPLNAVGLLHEELRGLGSILLRLADQNRVPAGDALAVDRDLFSAAVEQHIRQHPRIEVVAGEVLQLPLAEGVPVVVATGPLTTDALATQLQGLTGERLAFYDAIAPIISADSIDMEQVFAASRWGKGDGADYLNCPMDKPQYLAFVQALIDAEKLPLQDFEKGVAYFPGCQPVEVIAESGPKSLRFGPMKPTGLDDPRTGRWAYAVVQLRTENQHKTAYNLVGFQTKMRQGEQRRVLGMIPGLQNAEFLRYGSVHRNTFLDSPRLLDPAMSLQSLPQLRFAGQVTGVEGYVESTASGLWVGLRLAADLLGQDLPPPPPTSSLGAMLHHVVDLTVPQFQPSNIHFGLFPPLPETTGKRRQKADRKQAMLDRAREDLREWQVAHGIGTPRTWVVEPEVVDNSCGQAIVP
jgi:methylenetetrahydrofolate--tRNA-(uracil-5-)-methyltransferase